MRRANVPKSTSAEVRSGCVAAVFAATHPDRTSALVLFGTFARRIRSDDYPWHMTRDELVAATERIVEVWGTDETTGLAGFSPSADAALRRWWIARDRAGATPGAIRQLIMQHRHRRPAGAAVDPGPDARPST